MLKNKTIDSIPESIGHFKILGKLGKGGMGDVYKALQEPLDRPVALKVLPLQLSRDDEFARRFEIEAKAISLLQHQNIVNIFEYGDADGFRYFAMQYVDGADLSIHISEHRALGIGEIVGISKQICRGLKYAHDKGVIHRDIKPQNVLIDKKGIVRLSDFGIAKIVAGTNITMTGSAVGTPEYMSPEQAQGKKLDPQTDIYSLGIVMYEMLTKKPPFTANNPMAVAYKQVHEQPVPPSVKRKDTPKRLELIILKALKKDQRDRYESVEEMLDHLDSVDPEERVDRTTVFFKPLTKTRPEDEDDDTSEVDKFVDRRITDRRSGDRRSQFMPQFLSREYWIDMVKMNWLTWLALAGVASVLWYHIANHSQ